MRFMWTIFATYFIFERSKKCQRFVNIIFPIVKGTKKTQSKFLFKQCESNNYTHLTHFNHYEYSTWFTNYFLHFLLLRFRFFVFVCVCESFFFSYLPRGMLNNTVTQKDAGKRKTERRNEKGIVWGISKVF